MREEIELDSKYTTKNEDNIKIVKFSDKEKFYKFDLSDKMLYKAYKEIYPKPDWLIKSQQEGFCLDAHWTEEVYVIKYRDMND